MKYKFVGERFGQVDYALIPKYINEADIVFSLGRGAVETMMCGRIPIVFDYLAGDGIVTPDNITEIMKCNFSGRTYRIHFTVEQLVSEIQKYDSRYGDILREMGIEHFSAEKRIDSLLDIYQQAAKCNAYPMDIPQNHFLSTFISAIEETRKYAPEELQRVYRRVIKEKDALYEKDTSVLKQMIEEKDRQYEEDIAVLRQVIKDREGELKILEAAKAGAVSAGGHKKVTVNE